MKLSDQLKKVRETIAEAAIRAKRNPSEITLVAVTKNATAEQIFSIVGMGQLDLGENRVQQFAPRAVALAERLGDKASTVRWHMIGHLQRNKVKSVLPLCHCIHSVDSLRLAEELQAASQQLGRPSKVFLQVNTSNEANKFGIAVGAAVHLAEQIDTMDGLQLMGLMTMARQSDDPNVARFSFARLRELFEELRSRKIGGEQLKHLSMGMSSDYEVAIEEGATMVRLGTALFGPGKN